MPPQAWHTLLFSVVYGAVHATLLPQSGWPRRPQPWQPPALQVPWPPGHIAPAAMQVKVSWLQQPPPLHALPSQHGCPGPPQAAQRCVASLQVRPEAVQ